MPAVTPSSFVRLGWHFVRRALIRLVRAERGLARFRANYWGEDRLLPVAPEERSALHALSRCIACGMCDARFTAWPDVDRAEFAGPQALPLSYTRALPDYDALHRYLANLHRGDLERLERICPTRVPFRRLAAFAARRAAELSEHGTESGKST